MNGGQLNLTSNLRRLNLKGMYQRSETFFHAFDGSKLFLQKWSTEKSIGTIFITHGQGEHSDCYHRLINGFEKTGWNFVAWDLRGHGRSDGLRGYVNDFRDYVSDYHLFLETALPLADVKPKPVILLCHSMGGLIQTCALLEKPEVLENTNIKAQVLSSPLFGVSVAIPAWKDFGATFMQSLLPKITLSNEIKNEDLTRDTAVIREYELDTYRHGRVSSAVYLGFKREFPLVLSRAPEIKLPTFLHVSDQDPVVSSEAALKFFDDLSSENKGLKIIENGKHELYNDTVRADVIQSVIDFVEQFKKS